MEIIQIIGLEKSKALVKEYTDKAIYALETFDETDVLKELAYMLVNRKN